MRSIFIDTWGWLALGHRKDNYHAQVKYLYQEISKKSVIVYTSDYVLDELITLLFRREIFSEAVSFVQGILDSANVHKIQIEKITQPRLIKTWELRKKLQDKPKISFTDLTSMIIMQELGIHYVLTDDNHFLQVGFNFIRIP
jgi:predicted nucleic acid-binding protein